MQTYTHEEWLAEGKRRFGDDPKQWRFVCPSCKTEQTPQELLDAGVEEEKLNGYVAFSCIGRFDKAKGCNWTLGGFLRIHEAEVKFDDGARPVFVFAEAATEEAA